MILLLAATMTIAMLVATMLALHQEAGLARQRQSKNDVRKFVPHNFDDRRNW